MILNINFLEKNSIYYFLSRISNLCIQFIVIKLVTSKYTGLDISHWLLIISFLPFVALFDFGIGSLLISKGTTILHKYGKNELFKFIKISTQLVLFICTALSLLTFCFYLIIPSKIGTFFNIESEYILIFILFTIISFFNLPVNTAFQASIGTNRVKLLFVYKLLTQIIFLLIFLLSFNYGFKINFLASYSALAISSWVIYFFIWGNIYINIDSKLYREWKLIINESMPYLLMNLFVVLQFNLDTIFVAKFVSLDKVPIFAITQKIFLLPILFNASILDTAWPVFTKLKLEKKDNYLKKYFNQSRFKCFVLSCGSILILYMSFPFILNILGSNKYQINYSLFFIFASFCISNIFIGSQYSLLNGLQLKKICTGATFTSAILNPLLSIVFCRIFYVNGPILATVIVNLLISFILSIYINKNKLLN